MAKKEIRTDLWVYDLLKDANIKIDPQGCNIKEIDEALKTASKKGTGNSGYPEYCGVVKDFVIVIEDKPTTDKQAKYDDNGLLDMQVSSIMDYALNGAYFYAKHILENTNYKKAIAFGISGDEKHHVIKPIYLDGREYFMDLPEVESFISFNENNIDEYYIREILKEDTDEEKTTVEILKDAKELHEYLRNYGNLSDKDKPLVVSGILLALKEIEYKNFSIDDLIGDKFKTDGSKIYAAIEDNLKRSQVSPETKKDKLLSQFAIIKDTVILNEVNETLGKTPLKYYTEYLYNKLYKTIRYNQTSEDYLGRFYGEFMSYSGGDGQSLGIVLTPKHICNLFCELIDLKPEDVVLDPCCGTAGFLVSAMHYMLKKASNEQERTSIKRNQLHGYELQPYMFTIATTNMILRGDGKSNLICDDFLAQDANKLQLKGATVGMMNPPYSMGKVSPEKCELNFTEHLFDSLVVGGKAIVIVPQSSMTGKNKYEQNIKESILKHHTLEGVITLNLNTFYGVGTNPCIAVFTAGIPHPKDKKCKFIDFIDDGYKVSPHRGLIETESAKDKKQHLLDVWFDRIESETKFCVKSTIKPDDEWLHSFYYFNDDLPVEKDFEESISDYLAFQFDMIMKKRDYLFDFNKIKLSNFQYKEIPKLSSKGWCEIKLDSLIDEVNRGNVGNLGKIKKGNCPIVTAAASNQGVAFLGDIAYAYTDGITISLNGVGTRYSAYHDYPFNLNSDCGKIKFKINLNKFVLIFISTAINKNQEKFTYAYKANETRIKRQTILLPCVDGKIDYEYMEQYIKNIMYKQYKRYLDVLEG